MRVAPLTEWIPFAGWEGAVIGLPLAVVLLLHTAVAVALAHWILFRPERRVDVRRVLLAGLALGFAIGIEVGRRRGGVALLPLSGFGVINLVWHDLIYVVPTCAVRVLLRGRSENAPTRGAIRCAWLALAFLPVAAWAHLVEPYRLQVETTSVPVDARRVGSQPITVAVLADLQTVRAGEHERAAIDAIVERAPDIVLLPGDLFQASSETLAREGPALHDELARLDAPGGVWFVAGDVDTLETTTALLSGTKIRVLANEMIHVKVRDRDVTIAGLGDSRKSKPPDEILSQITMPFSDDKRARDAERSFVRRVETAPGDGDVRILFVHHPDPVMLLSPNSRVDLFVAGHTHGGQIVIPGFGPPITLTGLPRDVAAGGLHEIDGRRIFVGRGVGMERAQAPRVRLFCSPVVDFLEISDAR